MGYLRQKTLGYGIFWPWGTGYYKDYWDICNFQRDIWVQNYWDTGYWDPPPKQAPLFDRFIYQCK